MANPSLNSRIEELVPEAIDKYALGDDIYWGYGLGATPQGPAVIFSFAMASGLLGQDGLNVIAIPVDQIMRPTSEAVDNMVSTVIEQLREHRTEALSQANGHGDQGPVIPGGGLITP